MTAPKKSTTGPVNTTATDNEADALTAAEQRRIRSLCQQANKALRENSSRLEALANSLFSGLFNGGTDGIFGGRTAASPAYRFMVTLCGTELDLSKPQLSRLVRIGCLNHRLKTGGWTRLGWSVKQELLPLVESDGDLSTLMEGIKEAQKAKASVRSIREWVAARMGDSATNPDEPNAVSTATATRLFAAGRRLRTVATRRRLAERLGKLDNAAYTTLMSDLDATLKHLQQLREEMIERRSTTRERETRAAA